ncbi:hypothetical protein ACSBR1_034479 [Camellia fascicularis]
MAVDITATLVPHMNMPSSEPSVPPVHLIPCHAHRSDPFDMEHFGEGPFMGLARHGPSTVMPTSHFDPIECTQYISQSSPERDPLMSEHASTHHGHTLEPSWSPPLYRIETNVDETMARSSPTPHITLSELDDPLITNDFHIEREGEGQVHAPTRGTGRGRGCGDRRGRGRGVRRGRSRGRGQSRAVDRDSSAADVGVSQISAVYEGLPVVVLNICTVTIGDGQPPSKEAGEGIVRASPLDIQRVYSKRPRRPTHGRGCGTGRKLAH